MRQNITAPAPKAAVLSALNLYCHAATMLCSLCQLVARPEGAPHRHISGHTGHRKWSSFGECDRCGGAFGDSDPAELVGRKVSRLVRFGLTGPTPLLEPARRRRRSDISFRDP